MSFGVYLVCDQRVRVNCESGGVMPVDGWLCACSGPPCASACRGVERHTLTTWASPAAAQGERQVPPGTAKNHHGR